MSRPGHGLAVVLWLGVVSARANETPARAPAAGLGAAAAGGAALPEGLMADEPRPASPPSPPTPASRKTSRRKCTAWAAQAPRTSHDMVFRRDTLVRRATEEMEATYQLWDVDDALAPPAADDACRLKARSFCAANAAAPGLCRFQVHEGLQNGGWEAAASVDKPPPGKKRPKSRDKRAARH